MTVRSKFRTCQQDRTALRMLEMCKRACAPAELSCVRCGRGAFPIYREFFQQPETGYRICPSATILRYQPRPCEICKHEAIKAAHPVKLFTVRLSRSFQSRHDACISRDPSKIQERGSAHRIWSECGERRPYFQVQVKRTL